MGHMMAKDTVNPLSIAVLTGNEALKLTEMKIVLRENCRQRSRRQAGKSTNKNNMKTTLRCGFCCPVSYLSDI